MRLVLICCEIIIGAFLSPCQAENPVRENQRVGSLKVVVTDFKSNNGKAMIALFDSQDGYEGRADGVGVGRTDIDGQKATWTFTALAYGDYALRIFHDENDNGALDVNFMGIPKEPVGFSNNIKPRLSMPAFEKVKFRLDSKVKTVTIKVR